MKLYKSGSINTAKKRHNFRFTKSLGQNFLTDINIINVIIESSLIDEKSLVVEIGPGMGALTEGLTEVAGHVTAIEIDKNLIPVLEENFRDIKNFSLIQGDVLKVDIKKLIEDECEGLDFEPQSIRVVGNLPYYITTPIIMRFLEEKIPVDSITVMMQKEVGERILAEPATKAYGVLSLAVGYYCTITQVVKAPKEAFVPRPKVDSIVLRLDLREKKPVDLKSEKLFFEVIRSGFGQRRKTMNNSLAGVAGLSKENIEEVLSEVNIDGGRRAETLSMGEFAVVANGIWDYLART